MSLSPPASPSGNPSYSSLSGSLTSAFSWTLGKLASHQRVESPTRSERDGEGGGEYTPPPLPPIEIPEGHTLSRALAEEIRGLLPPRLQLHHVWTLVYSLELHGVSLGTLYKKARESRGAYVLVVKDSIGGVFGAFVNEPLRPSGRYYGSGECFLWKAAMLPPPAKGSTPEPEEELGPQHAEMIRFKAFPYSGMNDYVILCDSHFLSVGGGDGKFGLWLDDIFEKGVSGLCPTFGNEPLTEDVGGKFEVLNVELWRIGA